MATYPIKMLRDEDKKEFVPFTNAAAVVDSDNKSLQELMDNGKYKIQNNVTTSSANKGVLDAYQGKVLNDKFNNYIPLSQKGVANGVASLDAEGKVPSAQLPSYVDDVIESYIVSGSTALSAGWLSKTNGGTALTPEKGKIYLIMTSGTYQNKQYRWGGSTYVLCNPSDVNSVNGMTGVVTLKTLTLKTAAGTPNTINETFNAGTDKTITINVPTKTSHITNDSGFITSSASITGNAATATKATQDSAGNIIVDTYVKKTGGTMTGGLIVPTLSVSESHRFTTQGGDDASDLVLTVNDASYMVFEYNTDEKSMRPSNTTKGLVDLGSSTNKWNNVYANSFNGNVSGNASSATKLQTVRTINTVGFDGTANIEIPYLAAPDNRNILVPSTLKSAYISVGFGSFGGFDSATNDSKYVDYIGLNTWKNSSGGLVNALVFSKSAAALYHYSGSFDADTWTTKKQIAYTDSDITGNAATATTADKTKAALTIQKNGTTVGSTFNGSTARTINITVPTKVTDLSDNTNYVQKTDYASASTAGVVKLGTGLAVKDGVISVTGSATADSVEWAAVKNAPTTVSYWTNDSGYITRSSTMTGASASAAGTAGTVPAPAAGKQSQFLRGDGTWAEPSYAASAGSATKAIQDGNGKVIASSYLPINGGTLNTGAYDGLTIKRTDANGSSILFANSAGNLGHVGFSSAGDLIITKGAGTTGTADMLKISNAGLITAYGNIQPSTNNARTLGTSSLKWSNVYATTFTGNLSGTATNATHLTISEGSSDAERPILIGNPSAGATAQNVYYESTITANYAQSSITASSFKTGDAKITYNNTDKCVEFIFA